MDLYKVQLRIRSNDIWLLPITQVFRIYLMVYFFSYNSLPLGNPKGSY